MMEEAVCNGDVALVQEFIRSGADVNESCRPWHGGLSLLIRAIVSGYKDIALALLEAGADVHAKDSNGWTALHWACAMGSKEMVEALINRGSRVNKEGRFEGRTPLILAEEKGRKAISMCLLRAGASCKGLSQGQMDGLFRHACHKGNLLALQTLLKDGCSLRKLTEEDLLYLVHNLSKQEIEELLHCAFREGSVFAVHILLKNGCSVSILSREEQEELFHHACCENDVFVVHALLTVGCSVRKLTQEDLLYLVHNLSKQEIEELLHCACREGSVFAVHTLLKNGCSVSILSREEQEELFHHARRENDVFVVCTLLTVGCSVRKLTQEDLLYLVYNLSKEEVKELFCCSCHEGDIFVACTLLRNGCSISVLSTEEQEQLLHLACLESNVFGVRTLLRSGCSIRKLTQEDLLYMVHDLSKQEVKELFCRAWHEGCVFVVCKLVKSGCSVSILSREEQEQLLHHACCESDVLVVEALLASGCNMNCVYSTGYTPLMVATEKGHEEVVKKLILAGVNLGTQTANGDTAFHLAASGNKIQCGILLAEGGASVRTKNRLSQTPLDLGKAEFKEAIKQALSFTTRKALCIIGNAESGKSTLLAALQIESNFFLRKTFNRFRRVSDRRQRTAGIETVPHCSQRYGEVIFFDFAGQHEYHGPHQMFLESLLSKPGVSITLLLVVKTTEEEEAILHQLHRWLSPVALMATTASPQVIIIGSFLDKVKSKQEATAKLTRCIEATRKDLEKLPLEFVGSTFLNCRQPQSEGIDQICNFLQEIPIPEFRAIHTHYSLAWVLSYIRSFFTAKAVQLQEFSMWVQANKDNLPQTMPSPEEVCQDLSAAGHALYLPNREEPSKSWLVLDLPSILHDVYGTLFSQSKEIVNEFGLLHCQHLAELFSHLDLEMVQQLLISLDFCLPVDPSVLKVEVSKLTQCKEASRWLFFPALISAKPTSEIFPHQSDCYLCWQLRTAKTHSISACVLQTILLRLAAHFVVKHHLAEGAQQHCCSIWWNGIAWQSKKDVDVTVHITNNRVIQVVGVSLTSADRSRYQYLIDVISDILSTVHRLAPKLAADCYIVHPPRAAVVYEDVTTPTRKELFPVASIQNSIEDGAKFSLSLKDSNSHHSTKALVSELFGGCVPSLKDIKRINWTQPEPNLPQLPTGPSQPEPSQPEPSQPEPSRAEPNQAEPNLPQLPTGLSQPEPSQPEPSQPEPSQPEPSRAEPNQAEPNLPQLPTQPSQPEPSQPEPSQPEPNLPQLPTLPNQSEPNQPEPSRPEPSRPEPSQPEPSQPELSQPEPNLPQLPTGPNQSEPNQPEPSQPELSQPEPSQPKPNLLQLPTGPNQSEPSQPEPSRPEPSRPELKQPETNQPQLSQPEPSQPDVLLWTVYGEFIL